MTDCCFDILTHALKCALCGFECLLTSADCAGVNPSELVTVTTRASLVPTYELCRQRSGNTKHKQLGLNALCVHVCVHEFASPCVEK